MHELMLLWFSSLEPPNSLDLNGSHPRRIKLTAPNINLSLDQSEGSILSDDNLDSPDEIDINVDELDTPDEADSFEYTGHGKLPRDLCYINDCLGNITDNSFFVVQVTIFHDFRSFCWNPSPGCP